ncbi:MAG: transcription initiation factor IIB [archaeon]|nr:transcription initiation factor IIB [archaeon]
MKQINPKSENPELCPDCGHHLENDYERGERFCRICGFVDDCVRLDYGKDFRSFDGDESRCHIGDARNPLQTGDGLSTEISYSDRDCNGKRVAMSNRSLMRMRRLQRQSRLSNGAERSFASAKPFLMKYCERLGLSETVAASVSIDYRKASKKGLVKGRSIPLVVSSLIYAECRLQRQSRTIDEISEATGVRARDIGRNYRNMKPHFKWRIGLTDPTEFVPRFCCELKLPNEICTKTISLIRDKGRRELEIGRNPVSVAAASIYVVAEKRVTQTEIARVTGISEVTIRAISRNLMASA